ncbi:DDE-type integrase/transposase/recombinase [Deinococcus sp. QL22]|uniref:DDE-type integrase/transposase/recombinase n=1 Tax=Deinococcus sp. QL22 TaxID=2939437 RepID=UPI00353015A8
MFIQQWRSQYSLKVLCWTCPPVRSTAGIESLPHHKLSRRRYGAPRLQADLRAEGQHISRERISRPWRVSGLRAKGKRRFVRTTDSDHGGAVCPNVLNRESTVQHANTVWDSDLTFIKAEEGWLYLAVTLDLHSQAVVGYAMEAQMAATLPLGTSKMTVNPRNPLPGLLHHAGPRQSIGQQNCSG